MKSYPSYKDTGVEWIGEIPNNWELLKVKKICSFGKGQGLSKSSINTDGKNECILYGELFTTYKNLNVINKVVSRTDEEGSILSKGNEILIPGSTTTTGVDLSNSKFLPYPNVMLGGDIIILHPRENLYLPEFISLFLTYVSTPEFVVGSRGVTIYHIYPKQIREIYISLPPLPEQQQIVSFLDTKTQKIDELIEKTEKKIELLKEKRTSLINHCVTKGLNPNVEMKDSGVEWIGGIPRGWDIKKVKYIGTIKSGDGVVNTELDDNKEYPVYGGNGIMGYYDNFNREETILVIGRVGEKCGNVHLVNEKCWVTDNSLILSLHSNGFYDWVHYSLETRNLNTLRNQNTQPLITSTQLKNESIPFPPEKEQPHIVEYLDEHTQKIDSTIEKETHRIELLKEYRQSLISEVVTGKIDVRDEAVV